MTGRNPKLKDKQSLPNVAPTVALASGRVFLETSVAHEPDVADTGDHRQRSVVQYFGIAGFPPQTKWAAVARPPEA